MLSNGNESRLVVGSSDDGGHAVHTRGKTIGDISSKDATLSNTVDTLEEIELGRIEGGGLVQSSHLLNDNVLVSDDVLRGSIDLLRSRVVGRCGVGEVTSDEVVLSELDGEALALFDFSSILGEGELARRHVGLKTNLAHRSGVAETTSDLFASG